MAGLLLQESALHVSKSLLTFAQEFAIINQKRKQNAIILQDKPLFTK
jgi:hypothetical protein